MSSNPITRSQLLRHWQNYHPRMVAELQSENRLEAALESTAQQIDELMYDLMVVQGMQRAAAWEIVLDQYFLPEEADESDLLADQHQPNNPPETSE